MRSIVLLLFLFGTLNASAQKTDKKLANNIKEMLREFNGQAGIYLYDLKKNREVAINANTVFTSASMIKIPILLGVMDKIKKGELDYHQQLVYKDSLLYEGVDILGSFKNDEKIELSKVMMLMLTMSDNTASLWLQGLVGGGARINAILDSMEYADTRVNSRTAGREGDRAKYGWGQTTPKEMATIMMNIANGKMYSKDYSDKMLRLLSRNYWDDVGLSQVPAGVFVASKNGAVDGSRSEVMYVNGEGRRYVLCVCTQNNKDTSWTPENEAWVLIRKIAKAVWER